MPGNNVAGSSPPTPVVFSLGDPNGIGPEVLLRALRQVLQSHPIQPIIFGPSAYLRELCVDLRLDFDWESVRIISTGEYPYPPPWGCVQQASGYAALESLRTATRYCRDQELPLLVTPPVHKKALHLAGFKHPGQTEFVASFFESSDPAMTFFSERMNVLLITAHIAFKQVIEELSVERAIHKSVLFYEALRRIGVDQPRVAFSGLNPHASEQGLFGTEEEAVLKPVIERLSRRYGSEAFSGPHPPDTVFLKAFRREFDGVIALYHDQGLIPLKLVAFDSAVNTTLGLPIVRTSPDHGTAFDIAGKVPADPGSMIAAIELGLKLIQLSRP
jgi:4-hydroxythreonine-4-phosphate dehydrogenase